MREDKQVSKIMFIFNNESELQYKYEMFKELLGEKIIFIRDREWNCTWATGRNVVLHTETHLIFLTLLENCHRVGRVPYLFNLIQDKELNEDNLKHLEKMMKFDK